VREVAAMAVCRHGPQPCVVLVHATPLYASEHANTHMTETRTGVALGQETVGNAPPAVLATAVPGVTLDSDTAVDPHVKRVVDNAFTR
jgi:hypothetical protein